MGFDRQRNINQSADNMQPSIETQIIKSILFNEDKLIDDFSSTNISELILILRRNRIPVATLANHPIVTNLSKHLDFRVYLETEIRRLEYITSAYKEISRAWTDYGVSSIVIKSVGYFPYLSDNLDLLVPTHSFGIAEKILRELGYIELPHIREPYKKLYRKIQGDYFSFPVHIHTRIAWINSFLTDEEMFQDVQQVNGELSYLIPSPENCILITLAHLFYEDKSISFRDIYNLSLQSTNDVNWQKIWERADLGGWDDGLQFILDISKTICEKLNLGGIFINAPMYSHDNYPWYLNRYLNFVKEQKDIILPWKFPRILCKVMHFKKSIFSKNENLTTKLHDIWLLLWYMLLVKLGSLRRFPSYIISISGVDGSGKSTLAKSISDQLNTTFSIYAEQHWTRIASSKILEMLKFPFISIRKLHAQGRLRNDLSESTKSITNGKGFLSNHPRLRMLWVYILSIEYIIRLWILKAKAKFRGGIHIFDRFAVDTVVDLDTIYKFPQSDWVINCLPKPDLSIYLSIDGQTALQRSKTPSSVENINSSLKKFESFKGNFSIVLSGCDNIHSLTTKAISLILRDYFKKCQ